MREGCVYCQCGCGEPLPPGSSPTRRYLNPTHAKRGSRASARMGQAPRAGSPSPRPGGAPPPYGSLAEGAARRPLPRPEPQPPADPLPINDPSAVLRRRLLAEAEALLALPHVEAVTINARAGTVVSLRSTWDVRDCGDHYEAQACAGAPSFEVG